MNGFNLFAHPAVPADVLPGSICLKQATQTDLGFFGSKLAPVAASSAHDVAALLRASSATD